MTRKDTLAVTDPTRTPDSPATARMIRHQAQLTFWIAVAVFLMLAAIIGNHSRYWLLSFAGASVALLFANYDLLRIEREAGHLSWAGRLIDRWPARKTSVREDAPELVVMVGLPGSGKTTRATDWVNENPESRARVNRDALRMMLYGVGRAGTSDAMEIAVSVAERATVELLLRLGVSVVVDATHLRRTYREVWWRLAARLRVRPRIVDLTGVPVDDCISRDEDRPSEVRVGPSRIIGMWGDHEPVTLEELEGVG